MGVGEVQLFATTVVVMEDANHFYLSRGFLVHSEVASGDLIMRTFVKNVSRGDTSANYSQTRPATPLKVKSEDSRKIEPVSLCSESPSDICGP